MGPTFIARNNWAPRANECCSSPVALEISLTNITLGQATTYAECEIEYHLVGVKVRRVIAPPIRKRGFGLAPLPFNREIWGSPP